MADDFNKRAFTVYKLLGVLWIAVVAIGLYGIFGPSSTPKPLTGSQGGN